MKMNKNVRGVRMSRIGERIREERMKSGFSVKDFSKKLGIAESFVNDVELGKKIINENMIKKIEKLLNVTLSEVAFEEISEPVENIKEPNIPKNTNKQWEDAFSHLLKKIPVCDINLKEIYDYKYLPVIDKKIDGHSSDKIIFVKANDDSMRGFRIQKNDTVMIYQNSELISNSLLLIKGDEKNVIRQVKRLDANKALIISHSNEIKTETRDIKSIYVIGRCLKVEVDL
jgi:transcriptional regulator with XRE-family HTH domain